jgi:hypothetical protein
MLLHSSPFSSDFLDYLSIGWQHIIDVNAYDHLLFIMVLCAAFSYTEWRKILIIVTAFTIGHSLTLALSALEIFTLPANLVEVLIPVTILITAVANLFQRKSLQLKAFDSRLYASYGIALGFGLIHGLGFANNFRFFLGDDSGFAMQLFAFNSGLELGQIVVVICFMSALWLLVQIFGEVQKEWSLFISGAGAGVSLLMILEALK